MTVEDYLRDYRKLYTLMYADEASLSTTLSLWEKWDPSRAGHPDVHGIHRDCKTMEEEFFNELVELTGGEHGHRLPIHHLPFCLNEYNCSAWSAEDGYIVLIDENFFGLLFMSCVVLSLDVFGHVSDEELPEVRAMLEQVLQDHWLDRRPFYMRDQPLVYRLMEREYDSVEIGNYLFQSFKAFILLHEIGHHARGHTAQTRELRLQVGEEVCSMSVDQHSHAMELEADAYALNYFQRLLSSKDNSRRTFFKYTLPFAPALLFRIGSYLDAYKTARTGREVRYITHPHPSVRIAAMAAQGMPAEDELMNDYLKSLERCFPPLDTSS